MLFHLHTTGLKHYKDVLSIPGIAGLEIYTENGGPTLLDLLPVLKEILDKSRLILHVGSCFEQLPEVLRKLPREGLFPAVSNVRIRSDEEFRQFVSAHSNCSPQRMPRVPRDHQGVTSKSTAVWPSTDQSSCCPRPMPRLTTFAG